MKAVEFCYWLQGFFEISDAKRDGITGAVPLPTLDCREIDCIKRHLALVFKHEIDPGYSADPKVQAEMQAIHDKPTKPKKASQARPEPGPKAGPGYQSGGFGGSSGVSYKC